MRAKILFVSMAVASLTLILVLTVFAGVTGSLDPPGPPGSTSSYTLNDIYNRLNDGTMATQSTFAEPASGPGTSTGHTLNEIMSVAPAVDDTNGATTSDVLNGKTFWGLTTGGWGPQAGMMTNNGVGSTIVPTTTNQNMAAGYWASANTVQGDSDLVAANIVSGTAIFGVGGSAIPASGNATDADVLSGVTFSNDSGASTGAMPNNGAVTLTPTTTQQTIAMGYHNGSGYVEGDAALAAGNIRSGASIFGVAGDPNVVNTASGDAAAGDILNGKVAWMDGSEVTGTRPPAPVPKTGQTTAYASGDDGHLEAGVAWPSPRFVASSTGIVTDTLTGLIWLKNANCTVFFLGDGIGQNARNWSNALAAANLLAGGYCGLTDGSSAGDWRLPSVKELQSLIDFSHPYPSPTYPALPSGHPFINVQLDFYWSSTTLSYNPSLGWHVTLVNGLTQAWDKTVFWYVWPVRGGQ